MNQINYTRQLMIMLILVLTLMVTVSAIPVPAATAPPTAPPTVGPAAPYFLVPAEFFNVIRGSVVVGSPYIMVGDFNGLTVDANGDVLSYSVISQSNSDISCSTSGSELNCTLVSSVYSAVSTIVIEVDDGTGFQTLLEMTVSFATENQPPYLLVPANYFDITFVDLDFSEKFVVSSNFSRNVADPNGDSVSLRVLSQSDSNIVCDFNESNLSCIYVGPALDVISIVTVELDDGVGGIATESFTLSVSSTAVLKISSVSNDVSGTIEDNEYISLTFNSNKFPLTVVVEMVDSSDRTQKTSTYTVDEASDLPVKFKTPSGESDGTYTLELEVTSGDETVFVSAGSFKYDYTSSSSSSGSRRRSNSGTFFGTPVVETPVIEPPVVETPTPTLIDEISDAPNAADKQLEDIEVTQPVQLVVIDENKTDNRVSGQFTGSDDESVHMQWLLVVVILLLAIILILVFTGKRK